MTENIFQKLRVTMFVVQGIFIIPGSDSQQKKVSARHELSLPGYFRVDWPIIIHDGKKSRN